jgi:hypothetical protein
VKKLCLDAEDMGAINDLAESINDARRSIWDDASTVGRILILVVLIASGIGIPIIIITLIAQAIAE